MRHANELCQTQFVREGAAGRAGPAARFAGGVLQLQPLVLPQLGQAWQEPARCIWTPHCMQYGASAWLAFGRDRGVGLGLDAGSVTPARSRRLSSLGASVCRPAAATLASMLGGSAGMSPPWRVSVIVSSTPGQRGLGALARGEDVELGALLEATGSRPPGGGRCSRGSRRRSAGPGRRSCRPARSGCW